MASRQRLMIAALLVATPLSGAESQTATCNIPGNGNNASCIAGPISVAFTIERTVRLTVVQGATFNLLPAGGLLSTADYDAGYYDADGLIQLQVSANASWTAKIAATPSNFASGCPSRPASSLTWGISPAVRANAISSTATNVFSGGSATASSSQNVYFRATLAWATDTPVTTSANCKLPVTFSATSP